MQEVDVANDVSVTIHNLTGQAVEYRQGTTGAWVPLNNTTMGMKVSTATQFRFAGIGPYKHTKGSWVSAAFYDVQAPVGGTLSFRDQKTRDTFIKYNL